MRDWCTHCQQVNNLYGMCYVDDQLYYYCEKCHRFVCSESQTIPPIFSDNSGDVPRRKNSSLINKCIGNCENDGVNITGSRQDHQR
jgi:hypothetical protein